MSASDIIRVGLAVFLVIWLCFWLGRRMQSRVRITDWNGHGMDLIPVAKRIERVRLGFVGELQKRPARCRHGKTLLAKARRAVRCLSYFRGRQHRAALIDNRDAEAN